MAGERCGHLAVESSSVARSWSSGFELRFFPFGWFLGVHAPEGEDYVPQIDIGEDVAADIIDGFLDPRREESQRSGSVAQGEGLFLDSEFDEIGARPDLNVAHASGDEFGLFALF